MLLLLIAWIKNDLKQIKSHYGENKIKRNQEKTTTMQPQRFETFKLKLC